MDVCTIIDFFQEAVCDRGIEGEGLGVVPGHECHCPI